MSRLNLLDLLPSELEDLAESLGAPRYRGRQIASWIYGKGATDIGYLARRLQAKYAKAKVAELEAQIAAAEAPKVAVAADVVVRDNTIINTKADGRKVFGDAK